MLGFGFGESFHRRVPIADVADRRIEGVTQSFLLVQPLHKVTCGAATRDDFEAFFVKALANGGSDTPHTTCDVRYFLAHVVSPDL